jgi:hypothetical protein
MALFQRGSSEAERLPAENEKIQENIRTENIRLIKETIVGPPGEFH